MSSTASRTPPSGPSGSFREIGTQVVEDAASEFLNSVLVCVPESVNSIRTLPIRHSVSISSE